MWTKLVVILGFAVSFSAGWAVGRGGAAQSGGVSVVRTNGPGSRPSRLPNDGILGSVLHLNPEQQEQMRVIWSDVAGRGEQEDKRRQLRKERDESIVALIHSDNRTAYDAVLTKYSEQTALLEQDSRKAYEAAVKKTMEILTPEQRSKYDEILKRNHWDRGGQRPGGPGGPPGGFPGGGPGGPGEGPGGFNRDDSDHRRGGERATTRPAVEQ